MGCQIENGCSLKYRLTYRGFARIFGKINPCASVDDRKQQVQQIIKLNLKPEYCVAYVITSAFYSTKYES